MNELTIRIRQPNDNGKSWKASVKTEFTRTVQQITLHPERNAKDPVHAAITKFVTNEFRRSNSYVNRLNIPTGEFNTVINIGGCLVALSREGNRLAINGKKESLNTVASALSRLIFKSIFENDVTKLMRSLYASLSLPEDVKYCLENRVPYHFFEDFNKVQVRLNCQQISEKEIAIEISDGVWGTMTSKELESFCSFYLHNHRRSKKWSFISPQVLYERTIGEKPKYSDVKVMKEFLKQNRQQDIVEKRARVLVREIQERYPDRIKVVWKDDEPQTMYVRGKGYDWKIDDNEFKSEIQAVSTYVWNPNFTEDDFAEKMKRYQKKYDDVAESNKNVMLNAGYPVDKDIDKRDYYDKKLQGAIDLDTLNKLASLPQKPTNEARWRGPICIDNMAKGSSVGDQFVARALALLNDTMTVALVSTIRTYLVTEPNTARSNELGDENEMS